jgi:Secretion system C-terminal sorting domain
VIIDSAFNIWSYAPLHWGSGILNQGLFLEAPVITFLNRPIIPTGSSLIKSIPAAAQTQTTTSYLRVLNTTTANITLTDTTGNTIGFHDTMGFCTLIDGFPIIPATAKFQPPIGYYIPSGSYSINMDSFKDSVATLSVFGSSTVFSYWRMDAASNQSDRLAYKNGIDVGNPDAQTKTVNLEAISRLIGSERDFQILNCATVQNDSVRIATPDSNRVMFVNLGPSKIYDLNIRLAGASSSGQFTHARITVPAHSTHFIVPNWQDLSHQSVKIYLDAGNTGTISDSLLVTNQATGIKEQLHTGIPGECSLDQNYPNPFNPTTIIRYGLSHRSHVTLAVFNTLGQQVAILQNGEQDAGFHEVRFDGSRLASGVYFYSIEANSTDGKQSFRETKKMLFLK